MEVIVFVEIAVKFIRNGRVELQTPGDGERLSCIHAVFGKQFASTLIPVEYAVGGVSVSGYVCKPENARPNRTMQHYFVNNRYVKTQTGMVAVERAYKGMIMAGRFPACVLFIDLPAETVDANVHPAKIEIRFINEKPVFDAVFYGVRSALESRSTIRQMEIPREPVISPILTTPAETKPVAATTSAKNSPDIRNVRFLDLVVDDEPASFTVLKDNTNVVPPVAQTPLTIEELPTYTPVSEREPMAEPIKPIQPLVSEQTVIEQQPEIRVIGELFRTYILAQMGESLFIIDKHAAHERILYNKLKAEARVDEQMLLTPVAVTVSRDEHSALLESVDELKQAGITVEDFGGQCVLVRTFPMILSGTDIDATIREIAAGFVGGSREVQSSKLDWIYHSSACRAAIKAGDHSRPTEWLDLAKQVLLDDSIRFCPHGRPVCVEMTRKELEKQFGRIV